MIQFKKSILEHISRIDSIKAFKSENMEPEPYACSSFVTLYEEIVNLSFQLNILSIFYHAPVNGFSPPGAPLRPLPFETASIVSASSRTTQLRGGATLRLSAAYEEARTW